MMRQPVSLIPAIPEESRAPILVVGGGCGMLLGVALGLLPFQMAAAGLTILVALGLMLTKPTWALAAILLTIPFQQLTTDVGPIGLTPVQIVALLVLALAIIWSIGGDGLRLPRTPFDVPILVWIAVLFLGSIGAVNPSAAVKKAGIAIVYAGIYYVTVAVVKSTRDASFLLKAFIVTSALVALYAIWVEYQYLTMGIVVEQAMTLGSEGLSVPRAASTMTTTSALAALMTLAIPIAVALVVATGWRMKPIALAALGVLLTGLGFTFTRGAWLGTSVAMLVMTRDRRVVPIIIAVALAIVLLSPAIISERAISGGQTSRPEIAARFDYWNAAQIMIEREPLLGVGMNNFPDAFSRLQVPWSARYAATAHNIYLNTLAENGVIGFIAFFMTIGGVLLMCVIGRREVNDPEASIYLLGIGASLVAFLMHQLTESLLMEPAAVAPLWAFMGLAVAIKRGSAVSDLRLQSCDAVAQG